MEGKLTVYFEDPYWVGVFELEDESGYRVARVIFGSEPKDSELYAFVKEHYAEISYSLPLDAQIIVERKKSFKRMQRDVRKEVMEEGVGTRSQQAMKLQMAQNKKERITKSREQKDKEELLKFEIRQAKKKEKHKGH